VAWQRAVPSFHFDDEPKKEEKESMMMRYLL
jgi:hypothetical protein